MTTNCGIRGMAGTTGCRMSDGPGRSGGGCGAFVPSVALSALSGLVSGAEGLAGAIGDVVGREGKSHGLGTYGRINPQDRKSANTSRED